MKLPKPPSSPDHIFNTAVADVYEIITELSLSPGQVMGMATLLLALVGTDDGRHKYTSHNGGGSSSEQSHLRG